MNTMKHFIGTALLSAVALAGLLSCQQEPVAPTPEPSPDFDPVTNTVNTQFVLNISASSPETKMTETNTQALGSNFRGLTDVKILTFSHPNASGQSSGGVILTDPTQYVTVTSDPTHPYNVLWQEEATRMFSLNGLIGTGGINADNNARIIELSLPVGTTAMLFYGRAKKSASNGTVQDQQRVDNEEGALFFGASDNEPAVTETLDDIAFRLKPRLKTQEDKTNFTLTQEMLAAIMTSVVKSALWDEINGEHTELGATKTDKRYGYWEPVDATSLAMSTHANLNDSNPTGKYDGVNAPAHNDGAQVISGGITYTFHTGEKAWSDYGEALYKYKNGDTDDLGLNSLEEVLGDLYYQLTNIRKETDTQNVEHTELRGGTAQAILRMVHDMWTVLGKVSGTTPTNPNEIIATQMATEIQYRLQKFFTNDANETKFRDKATILSVLKNYAYQQGSAETKYASVPVTFAPKIEDNGQESSTSTNLGFPYNFGMPSGAALMRFNHTSGETKPWIGSFEYYIDIPAYGMGGATASIYDYRYPPELLYFGNSPLRVTDDTHETSDYPALSADWVTESNWTNMAHKVFGWKSGADGVVTSSTRSVAMKNEINYGVAILKTTVKYGAGTIYDNNSGVHPGEQDNAITAGANAFTLKGVIVGGQPDVVGWDFIYKAGYPNNSFNAMVYDQDIAHEAISAYGSTAAVNNYTLLFDNYYDTALNLFQTGNDPVTNDPVYMDTQMSVYVALEFENNTGKDIWGEENMIRNGGRFYIIGKLKQNSLGNFPERPANYSHPLPPYKENGDSKDVNRVFIQDFMTDVTFTFGEHSLRNAYVTVPDLRSSQVSLGLSVDIKWSPGNVFNNVVLGSEM